MVRVCTEWGIWSREEYGEEGWWEVGAGNDQDHWTCKNRGLRATPWLQSSPVRNICLSSSLPPSLPASLSPLFLYFSASTSIYYVFMYPSTAKVTNENTTNWFLSSQTFHSSEGDTQRTSEHNPHRRRLWIFSRLDQTQHTLLLLCGQFPSHGFLAFFGVLLTRLPKEMNNQQYCHLMPS